jgi:hypothetical protein
LSNNTASLSGGALAVNAVHQDLFARARVLLSNATVSDNTARMGDGGAVYVIGRLVSLLLDNGTVASGNSAPYVSAALRLTARM